MTARLFHAGDRMLYGPLPKCPTCAGRGRGVAGNTAAHIFRDGKIVRAPGSSGIGGQMMIEVVCQSCDGTGYDILPEVTGYVAARSVAHGWERRTYVPSGAPIPVMSGDEYEDRYGAVYWGPAYIEWHANSPHRFYPAWDGAQEYDDGADLGLNAPPLHEGDVVIEMVVKP